MRLFSKPAALLAVAVAAFGPPALNEVPTSPSPGVTVESWSGLSLVRTLELDTLGFAGPTGLDWSEGLGALVATESIRHHGRLTAFTPDEDLVGRVRLPGGADADGLAVDPSSGAVTVVSGARSVTVAAAALRGGHGAVEPSGLPELPDIEDLTYDHTGDLVLLDDGHLVRVAGSGELERVTIDVPESHELRGLTTHPETGELYTLDMTERELLALDAEGHVVTAYATDEVDLFDVRGIAFAPSGNPGDDPSAQRLFIADAGVPGAAGTVLETALEQDGLAAAYTIPESQIREVPTSAYSPPSPDPSGVAYLPGADRLVIVDGEVDEMSIFRNVNMYLTARVGAVQSTGVSQPWSDEPVGVGYNPGNNHLFVSDDDAKTVSELTAGTDGRFGTSDDGRTTWTVDDHGISDPEGIDYDPVTNSMWFAGGEAGNFHRQQAGTDGRFGTSDDVYTHWDGAGYGIRDPEGLGYDAARDTIAIVDDSSQRIYELDKTGALLNTLDVSAVSGDALAGLAVGPSTSGGGRSYYVVARGQDNDSNPNENDGRLYEIANPLPSTGGGAPTNQAPSVDAGTDRTVTLPSTTTMAATVTDDGEPDPPGAVGLTWSTASGPGGTVTFSPSADVEDPTVAFSTAGTYVLRLTANDGAAITADEVVVQVAPVGGGLVTESRVASGSDDVEQGVSSGSVSLNSSDLELTTDGTTQQVVGLRFPNLQVPRGATITSAHVQFRTDEVSTGTSAMTIRAQNSDTAAPYTSTAGNVTSRPTTAAVVAWSPPDWTAVGEAGAAQRTPDLRMLVQAVVDRTGWVQGSALGLQLSGTGRRTAEAFEGGASLAPLLHVEYTIGGSPPANRAPVVSAGTDQAIMLPATATMAATVSDDGLPTPPTLAYSWSQVSGPGTANFSGASAGDPVVTFSAPGHYVLRLTVSDGELEGGDDVAVTVDPASGGGLPPALELRVSSGSDDAEQSTKAAASTLLSSSDLELTTDGTTVQVVGVRFRGLQVPRGATITHAYVQFRTDEVGSTATALTIRAEDAGNTPTYAATANNVIARATTPSGVTWSPPAWAVVGETGPAQRTPDLKALVQTVVDRPDWVSGNALAFQFSGTGVRKAVSFEGDADLAPLLHLEYTTGSGGPLNAAPVVDAGADQQITLPDKAALAGAATDDGLPAPPALSYLWSQVSGPGTATFSPGADSTGVTASFAQAGVYVLRLTVSDGELEGHDDVTITVGPAAGGGTPQTIDVRVSAGSDDAEQSTRTGRNSLTSDDLEITTDGSTVQLVGVRFAGLGIPQGARITSAYVQFRVDGVTTAATSLQIRAEDADNTPTYTTAVNAVSSRATTPAGVAWAPPGWTTVGASGPDQRTPDLSPLVQAVVGRARWGAGNALAFQFSGTGARKAVAFEGGAGLAPLLHVEYVVNQP